MQREGLYGVWQTRPGCSRGGMSVETTEYYSEQRRRHYGEFYGLIEASDDRPLCLVWGNCQAEALRIVLSSAEQMPYRTMRVPPVHELRTADLPFVERAVCAAGVLVSQPVRTGYRGLPIGTSDMLGRPGSPGSSVLWPVVRYAGLHPFQVIVRHPSDPSAVPPGVPYHDLRTVLGDWETEVSGERVRAAAAWSIDELVRRESLHCDVGISDVLLGLGERAAHTINHPGNDVLMELGRRILSQLGGSDPVPPQRDLLGMIRAPLEAGVIDALGLDAQESTTWTVNGSSVEQASIRDVQTRWYTSHPEIVDAAVARYDDLIDILGLST